MIEAREGWKIAELDYSQMELRVASWLSGDENMMNAYKSGSDLHTQTQKMIYGEHEDIPKDEAKRHRTNAKITNFSLVYGAVPSSLVKYAKGWGIDIPIKEAEELHEKFFEAYPKLKDFYRKCQAFTSQHGYIESPTGRRRYLPDIYSSNYKYKSSAERQCINTPVQGMASDLCISAMADIVFSKELDHSRFNVLGTVHDAILIEVREDYAEELSEKCRQIMENSSLMQDLPIPVPIVADVEIGQSWGGG